MNATIIQNITSDLLASSEKRYSTTLAYLREMDVSLDLDDICKILSQTHGEVMDILTTILKTHDETVDFKKQVWNEHFCTPDKQPAHSP